MTREVFKGIIGFDNYKVSNLGKVLSFWKYPQGKEIYVNENKSGYYYVSLYRGDGSHKAITIHRLVALAFVSNPDPEKLVQVNHKDEDKHNNRADNLEWCDAHYNNSYGGHGKRAGKTLQENQIKKELTTKVTAYKEGKYYHFDSASECARKLNIDVSSLINLLNGKESSVGKYRSLGGYQFSRQGEEDKIDLSYKPQVHVQRSFTGTKDGVTKIFDSVHEASRDTGVNRKSIHRSLKDNAKLRSGWDFNYIE